MPREKRTCDTKNRTLYSIYFDDKLSSVVKKHQHTVEGMTGKRPSFSAIVNQAVRDYMVTRQVITEKDGVRKNFLVKEPKEE